MVNENRYGNVSTLVFLSILVLITGVAASSIFTNDVYADSGQKVKKYLESIEKEKAALAEAEQKAKEEAAKKAEAEQKAKEEAAKKAEAEQKAKEEAAKKAEAEKELDTTKSTTEDET
ncbi:MAG TPA: hypothetical protein VD731_07600, partial [Nitrosopumilaceae archaeon]|nr:hypothetical protein [Nitrosopumilaceae archaeon]